MSARGPKMVEDLITFGNRSGLNATLRWTEQSGKLRNPANAALGTMHLAIGARNVWYGEGDQEDAPGLEWGWIDLLEFLGEAWPFLEWQEGYPFGLKPMNPSLIRIAAEDRWQDLPEERVEIEEEEIYGFEETHDLARSFKGARVPSVWLLREGSRIWIASREQSILRPLDETMDTLSKLGNEIASRLDGLSDGRSLAAIEAWKARRNHDSQRLAAIATRLPAEVLRGLGSLEKIFELPSSGFEYTELLAAARMTQCRICDTSLRAILDSIRDIPLYSQRTELDRLSREAEHLLGEARKEKPYDQGYCLAGWLSGVLKSTGLDYPFDPRAILDRMGVLVKVIEIPEPNVDAIACWGPRHGPAIIVNERGVHSQQEKGQRSTLAHEICHLLIDRTGALPLVEILNGSAPPNVEARARAFAAELLLPRDLAYESVVNAPNPEAAVNELGSTYGVSKEIIAWQVRNAVSSLSLPPDVHDLLRSFVLDTLRF